MSEGQVVVQRIWRQYSPLFHILFFLGSLLFTAGFTWSNFSKYEARISRLETKQDKAEKLNIRMDGNVELIMRALHIEPLPPVHDRGDE